MPHRTVFQWGKNHVHPFTMFIGGFVVGSIVTGSAAWAWAIASDTDIDIENSVKTTTKSPAASVSPAVQTTASPSVSF